jgi:predicted nuclease of predicted toxin-antitoxin system
MASLRFLVDMNLSPRIVIDLSQQGWDILRVSQVLPMDTEDSEILEFARQENRVIITQDLDFSSLLALGGYEKPSLITFRLSVPEPETITRKLLELLPHIEDRLAEGCAVTIDDRKVRVRRLPIL